MRRHSASVDTRHHQETTDMANEIAVQKQPSKSAAPVRRSREWDPFRAMRELMRWNSFPELAAPWPMLDEAAFAPDFDVKETKESFVFTADLPGVAEKDLQVQLSENRLTISGKRESEKTEQNETYYASERSYGSFSRTFTLPEGIDSDKVHAELKHGVLSVLVPKRPEALPKKINVTSK
jgi:HSP20 family protein